MNFYKRYPGDYARDTAHLTLIEHGAYSLLMDHYYSTESALPGDYQSLYRICRAFTKSEQQAVKSVADRYFPLAENGLRINARIERQMPQELKGKDAARENGKKGGRPKKNLDTSTDEKPSGFSKDNPAETQRVSQTKPNAKAPPTPYPNKQQIEGREDDNGSDTEYPRNAPSAADPIHLRSVELTALLRKRGAALQAADPNVRQWAADGVTDSQALWALEVAQTNRAKAGSTQPVNAGYLTPILAELTSTTSAGRMPGKAKPQAFDPVEFMNRPQGANRHDANVINGTAVRVD